MSPYRIARAAELPASAASRERWFAQHLRPDRPLRAHEPYDGTVELSVYVHERHRWHGIAAAFIAEAQRVAPALGIHTLLGLRVSR